MQVKTWGIAAAMAVGLGLGIVVGPSLREETASAQTQPPAQTATAVPTKPATANLLRSTFLDQLAAALNIQRSALDSAITSAGTKTADAAVQQGTLTQAQADALKARIQAGDLGALLGGRGGPVLGDGRGAKPLAGVQQALLNAGASALGITTDELRTQLRSGQTLAQLAQSNNTTEQAVISAALAAAKTQLDQAVTAGTLTQAQADAAYAQLQQRGAQLFSLGGRGHGGRGLRSAPVTPQATTTPGI